MPEQATVTVSKAEWDRIQRKLNWLRCLESAGVDNWSGISYAYEIRRENYPEPEDEE